MLPVAIPSSHLDLLQAPIHAILTTLMPDGQPQSSMVWVAYADGYLLLSTSGERQKTRNLQANPKCTLLVVDPADGSRWIEIRGEAVEFTTEHAVEVADALTHAYTGKQHFYGDVYSVDARLRETRVVVKIAPRRVTLDAKFK